MYRALLTLLLFTLLAGCGPAEPTIQAGIDAVAAVNSAGDAGFARVTEPRPFVFPQDHGPHPEYAIEWWYYTGNLFTSEGRRFGYQLTFFRSGLTPDPAERNSNWAASSVYMAHFALSDIASGQFYATEQFSRDAAGLAGATGDPFRVFLNDWSVDGSGPEGMTMLLRAASDDVAINLNAVSSKPPALQGERGYSQKGNAIGNASYYYSLTRMETSGTVRVGGEEFAVSGLTWMDHEFGTSALEGDAEGWDWFSLQLADGHELMYAQVRTPTGIGYSFGSLIAPDGTLTQLDPARIQVEPLATWRSPRSEAVYPIRWRMRDPSIGLDLTIAAAMPDQELPLTVLYWEGAVDAEGSLGGNQMRGTGYVELTGYAGRGEAIR